MTYDFYGHWDKKTGHVAPLYHHPDAATFEFNVVSLIVPFRLEYVTIFLLNIFLRRAKAPWSWGLVLAY